MQLIDMEPEVRSIIQTLLEKFNPSVAEFPELISEDEDTVVLGIGSYVLELNQPWPGKTIEDCLVYLRFLGQPEGNSVFIQCLGELQAADLSKEIRQFMLYHQHCCFEPDKVAHAMWRTGYTKPTAK